MPVFFDHVQCLSQVMTDFPPYLEANAMLHLQLNTNKQNSFVLQWTSIIAGRCEFSVSLPKLLTLYRAALKLCCSTNLWFSNRKVKPVPLWYKQAAGLTLLPGKASDASQLMLHNAGRHPRCLVWKNAALTVFLWLGLPDVSLVYPGCCAGVFLVVWDYSEIYSLPFCCSTNPFLFTDVASYIKVWLEENLFIVIRTLPGKRSDLLAWVKTLFPHQVFDTGKVGRNLCVFIH